MALIRPFQETDWPAVWPILHATFQSGDTYANSPQSTEAETHLAWVELPAATFVACSPDGQVVGSYILKPNQPGLGGHVCNCGYVVAPEAQGQGIASAMCEHSQTEALSARFRGRSGTSASASSMLWSCSKSWQAESSSGIPFDADSCGCRDKMVNVWTYASG
jgi:predicted N-acetyltransferase YhbS